MDYSFLRPLLWRWWVHDRKCWSSLFDTPEYRAISMQKGDLVLNGRSARERWPSSDKTGARVHMNPWIPLVHRILEFRDEGWNLQTRQSHPVARSTILLGRDRSQCHRDQGQDGSIHQQNLSIRHQQRYDGTTSIVLALANEVTRTFQGLRMVDFSAFCPRERGSYPWLETRTTTLTWPSTFHWGRQRHAFRNLTVWTIFRNFHVRVR